MTEPFPVDEAGVLAVLVIYRRPLSDVPGWPTLRSWLDQGALPDESFRLRHVLVHDNSPTATRPEAFATEDRLSWQHDPDNGGTRAAYLSAARRARALGLRWILLLDHDTGLPADLLALAGQASRRHAARPAAWLPVVYASGHLISPAILHRGGTVEPLADHRTPKPGQWLTGVASGSLVEAQALLAVPPPPDTMWLDGVDHWFFLHLQRHGRSVARFDAVLQHELSVLSLADVSVERARSIVGSMWAFIGALPPRGLLVQPARCAWFLLNLARLNPLVAWRLVRSWIR